MKTIKENQEQERYKKLDQAVKLLMEAFDLYAPKETREGQGTEGTMAAFIMDLQGDLANELGERVPTATKEMLMAVLSHEARGHVSKRIYDQAVPVNIRYEKSEFLLPEAERVVDRASELVKAMELKSVSRETKELALAEAVATYKRLKEYSQ